MTELDLARPAPTPFWGWEIPAYLFLGGLAAGVMIVAALLAARGGERSRAAQRLAFAPPLLLSLGMAALFLDLAQRGHVLRFYLALRPASPMSWGAWILLLVYPITLAAALAALDDAAFDRLVRAIPPLARPSRLLRALGRDRAPLLRRALLALGVALGVYTGILLSSLGAARPLWGSALLGPLFLASGVSTGAAFVLLFPLSAEERAAVARWDLAAVGVEGALLALLLAGLATSGAAGAAAAGLLLGGRFTAQFWVVVVLGGLALPAGLHVLGHRLALPATRVAPLLVLAGGFALRWILVAAGQAT
jgi:formate-dependent nitrite reductase membrane component NrfD